MKRITLIIALLVAFVSTSFAQQNRDLEAVVTTFNNAQTFEQIRDSGNAFERVSLSHKEDWLAAYYTSLVNMILAFAEKTPTRKDALLDKADEYQQLAARLQPDNDEVEILRANIASGRITVDPNTRWEKYGQIISSSMKKAKKLNPDNPRLSLLSAQSIFYTPEQYGGGKEKALPIVKESLMQFAHFKPSTPLHPTWGEDRAKELLVACEKANK